MRSRYTALAPVAVGTERNTPPGVKAFSSGAERLVRSSKENDSKYEKTDSDYGKDDLEFVMVHSDNGQIDSKLGKTDSEIKTTHLDLGLSDLEYETIDLDYETSRSELEMPQYRSLRLDCALLWSDSHQ